MRFVNFWWPCRGRSTWKSASPPELWFYMTRRAFLALRVIPVQGKFDHTWWNKRIWLEVSSGGVFRRFLVIHEFVLHGASKINYFRSRRVRWSIRKVQDNVFSFRIIAPKFGCMHQHFRKSALSKRFRDFGRPCRGRSTWKGASPQLWIWLGKHFCLEE